VIFRQATLAGIRNGSVTLAFRRWVRPSVRSGGTLLTPAGELEIRAVTPIALEAISDADARRAGYTSVEALRAELERRDGDLYRIELGALRPDPRIALRQSPAVGEQEVRQLRERLHRLDDRSAQGPWTVRVLEAIESHPGLRAARLCRLVGQEMAPFKLNVRKLKALGLTESLETGYRVSPRGAALLRMIRQAPISARRPR
jgi:hypothetical protein